MKDCSRCGVTKPLEDFGLDTRMKSGRRSWCRPCARTYQQERYYAQPEAHRAINRAKYQRNYSPERRRRDQLKHLYGLTLEAFDDLLRAQNGECAICRTTTPGGRGSWHVDHCHQTNRVRGVLCAGCNVGLGHMQDDPVRLRAAAAYLERSPA